MSQVGYADSISAQTDQLEATRAFVCKIRAVAYELNAGRRDEESLPAFANSTLAFPNGREIHIIVTAW